MSEDPAIYSTDPVENALHECIHELKEGSLNACIHLRALRITLARAKQSPELYELAVAGVDLALEDLGVRRKLDTSPKIEVDKTALSCQCVSTGGDTPAR